MDELIRAAFFAKLSPGTSWAFIICRFFAWGPARYSGHTGQRRFNRPLANLNEGFGIKIGRVAPADNVFVARVFSFLNQPSADPPHQRVEPENRFDDHVDRHQKIVAAPHMAQLVRENCLYLGRREAFGEYVRQKN